MIVIKTAHNAVRVDDLLAALLSRLLQHRRKTFTANRVALHTVFLKLKGDFAPELSGVRFRDRGMFSESRSLDQAICNLEAAGLLHRKNQTPLYYEIDSAVHDVCDRFAAKRLNDCGVTKGRLDRMGDMLCSMLPRVA